MTSVRLSGVLFVAYPQDLVPRHVHGFVEEVGVIVNLGPTERWWWPTVLTVYGREMPSAVRRVLNGAAEHFDELVQLWERMHE